MKKLCHIFLILLVAPTVKVQAEESAPLRLVQTIPLPNVEGRIDHIAVDLNSALLGFIWESPWRNVFIDVGVRRGISRAAADWMFTTGLTFSFSLATTIHN